MRVARLLEPNVMVTTERPLARQVSPRYLAMLFNASALRSTRGRTRTAGVLGCRGYWAGKDKARQTLHCSLIQDLNCLAGLHSSSGLGEEDGGVGSPLPRQEIKQSLRPSSGGHLWTTWARPSPFPSGACHQPLEPVLDRDCAHLQPASQQCEEARCKEPVVKATG